ncbi:MAG TPA: potassium transporter TrkG, partial [Bacillota bacterium]
MVIEPAAGERRARGVNPARALVLGFAGIIFVGTLLLALPFAAAPGVDISWLDALFTATSAVCVTGLAVVNTAEAWSPFGQAVILILIQVGGLGLMTMSTLIALLLGKRITLRERLLIQVSLQEFSLSGLVRLTRYVLLATLMLEAIGTLILTLRFGPEHGWRRGLWLGVFHAVSAFNNAGFDLFGNSLIDYVGDVTVIGTIAGLIMLGGLGFSVLVDLFRWPRVGWRGLSLHSKVVLSATAALVVVPTLAILAFEYNNPATLAGLGWKNKLLAAFFQAVTPRTAGFNSLAIDGMRAP